MSTALKRRNRPRRGVTLVEMLVVVALVVLMMVILVQIFQSALGAMSASRTTQELDVVLRSIDSMIATAFTGFIRISSTERSTAAVALTMSGFALRISVTARGFACRIAPATIRPSPAPGM